jgi:hypothetical protein
MTQSLFVDTVRLESAGATLQGRTLPQPPAPIATAGTDAVSLAINETMPVVESPVLAGLPAAQTALAQTAANLTAAAGRYADTDNALGGPLAQHEFVAADGMAASRAGAGSTARQASTAPEDLADAAVAAQPVGAAVPSEGDVLQDLPSTAAQMGPQVSQVMGTAGSFAQGIFQNAKGAAQNQPLTGRTVEAAEKKDAGEEQHPEESVEEAAPGIETGQSAPGQVGVDGGQPFANTAAVPASPPADRATSSVRESGL